MIRIKRTQVEIRPEFRQAISDLARLKLESMKEQIEYAQPYTRAQLVKDWAVPISRLNKIRKGEHDELLTKLRTLGYTFIGLHSYYGRDYIYARTNDIILEERYQLRRDHAPAQISLGEYSVFLPVRSFIEGHFEWLQMIPMRNPQELNRHMHHYGNETDRYEMTTNPLDMYPHTCIGSVGTPMGAALRDGDFAEVMRYLLVFLRRYNPGSPLRSLPHIPHAQEVL